MRISHKINRGAIIPSPKLRAKLALFFICPLAGLLLAGCTALGASPTLKIGLVAPFEGLHRPLGYEALFAVKLALQERNAAGGLQGVQVELVALNDFDDPAEAVRQAEALVADPGVVGVVGHLSSEATLAALPVYQAADLAVAVPWSLTALPLESRAGVVTLAVDQAEAVAGLEAMAQAEGLAPLYPLTRLEDDLIEAGGGTPLLLTDGVTAGEIILALDRAGLSQPRLGGPDAGSPQLIDVAGSQANGFVFVSPGPAPADVAAADFEAAYQALAGFKPGPRAVLVYDATQVLLDGIEAALHARGRLPSRAEVSLKIKTVQRPGLSGALAFDEAGRRQEGSFWLYQINEGVYPGLLIAP